MKRVAVVGSGGAGKSTFSNELALYTGLPVYRLDELHWLPGWKEPPDQEWREKQAALVARENWIIDGNYGKSVDIRFNRADTVILLALPRRVCIFRALKRVAMNWHKSTQARGCPEHLDLHFLRWLWRFPYDARPLLNEALARNHGQFELVELKTRFQVRRYLDSLSREG